MSSSGSSFALSKYIYTVDAITQAAHVFAESCTTEFRDEEAEIRVILKAAPEAPAVIAEEFLKLMCSTSPSRRL